MKERAIRTATLLPAAWFRHRFSGGASADANLAIGAVIDRTGPRATASGAKPSFRRRPGNRGPRGSPSFWVRFEIVLADSGQRPQPGVPRAQDPSARAASRA